VPAPNTALHHTLIVLLVAMPAPKKGSRAGPLEEIALSANPRA
jgi:hypothetical protein